MYQSSNQKNSIFQEHHKLGCFLCICSTLHNHILEYVEELSDITAPIVLSELNRGVIFALARLPMPIVFSYEWLKLEASWHPSETCLSILLWSCVQYSLHLTVVPQLLSTMHCSIYAFASFVWSQCANAESGTLCWKLGLRARRTRTRSVQIYTQRAARIYS